MPGKGQVLVRVMAAGICGSDIPRAYTDGAHNMPIIPGHEFAGTVEDVGEGVSSALIGRRVGVFPLIPCKKCTCCKKRQYEMCRDYDYLGSRSNGAFAEYVVVPEWNLIGLPDEVSFEAAAMLEPMAVAVHAIRQLDLPLRTLPDHGPRVAVIGLGTIGTLVAAFLYDRGYRDLLVIGNKDFQKKTLKGIGIAEENYCDIRTDDAGRFIMDRTNGAGADAFFECVGSSEAAMVAIDNAAPSGKVCFVGNPRSDMTFDKKVYWKILRNQLKISGTWNSSFLGEAEGADDDWHYVIDRLVKGGIDPQKLITGRYPPERITEGFELMRDKKADYIKVMCIS
ncbi:MAG: galactitol-1-phosphate 5-dehydrogenase [Lachnospiraceae bacterium]|nr:galactitol-1-phosphate 5-dehydrogenase [Lachnospiraceae bacterium]